MMVTMTNMIAMTMTMTNHDIVTITNQSTTTTTTTKTIKTAKTTTTLIICTRSHDDVATVDSLASNCPGIATSISCDVYCAPRKWLRATSSLPPELFHHPTFSVSVAMASEKLKILPTPGDLKGRRK